MSNNKIPPPPVPPTTGPRSPQDVPPEPGSFPIDPDTLPEPIRDELLAPDPVAIDTSSAELKDGLNRCPKCGATEIRHKPGSDLRICLYCRNEWHGARVEEEFGFGVNEQVANGAVPDAVCPSTSRRTTRSRASANSWTSAECSP